MKKTVTVKLSEDIIMAIDELVYAGKYKSRSDFVKKAIEEALAREEWHISLMPVFREEAV